MDPIDFRIKNAAKEGTRASYGPTYGPIGIGPTLQAAKNHPHMKAPLGKNQGRGMACGFWFNFGGQTCTDLNIGVDGTVSLTVGTVDVGGSRASLSLIAAEELGIPYERVKCTIADTASLGHNDTTEGSRGTFSSGMATIFAARNAIQVLRERAAKTWDIDVADVEWKDGQAVALRAEHGNLDALTLEQNRREIGRRPADRSPATTKPLPTAPAYRSRRTSATSRWIRKPARRRCIRYTVIQDAGKAIHPDYVEGQFQGAAAQGIGWALNEEYVYGADGRLQNAGFLDYRIPVCSDLPFIDTQILEIPNPGHPYGVRGVGETSIVPPLAAIANAVSNAVGRADDAHPDVAAADPEGDQERAPLDAAMLRAHRGRLRRCSVEVQLSASLREFAGGAATVTSKRPPSANCCASSSSVIRACSAASTKASRCRSTARYTATIATKTIPEGAEVFCYREFRAVERERS